jgi:hypothetical protein
MCRVGLHVNPEATDMPSNLRIDTERLWAALMETAALGATAKGGINGIG